MKLLLISLHQRRRNINLSKILPRLPATGIAVSVVRGERLMIRVSINEVPYRCRVRNHQEVTDKGIGEHIRVANNLGVAASLSLCQKIRLSDAQPIQHLWQ